MGHTTDRRGESATSGWTTSLVLTAGSFTVQRRSGDPEHRARLVQIAELLRTVAHPGVESFVALEDDGASTTLVTAFAGGRDLSTGAPRRARDLARLGAAILAILADLHDLGVTHGPLTASAIRLHAEAPVLCGFVDGRSYPVDEPASWWAARAVDERSVGQLLADLVDDAGPTRRHRIVERVDRARLRRLAERIAHGDLDRADVAAGALRRLGGRRHRRRRRPAGRSDVRSRS